MKKILSIMAAVALVMTLAACKEEIIDEGGANTPVEDVEVVLEVIIEEVEESRILVNSEIGRIWFSYSDVSELEAGDVIKVTYEDGLAESDPMQGTMISYEMITEYVAPNFDLSASEIVQHLVNESGAELFGMEDVITADNQQWFLGAGDYPEFTDSAVFAPMMNVDVSLIVVVKTESLTGEELQALILDSIDPQRLVCVSFDLETDVIVDSYGDTTVLIINKQFTEEIHEAFIALQ